jgi:hydroxymethylglutaryl-CoA lyase
MEDTVKIVECPRDAWQALQHRVPAKTKAAMLRTLLNTGFRHIDAVSFVSPVAVPQMADSEEVLALLGPADNAEIIGIVVNAKGAERAIATASVHTLGFPYSISRQFLRRNQNQSPEESFETLQTIIRRARDGGLEVVAYVSMAFGNPYGDAWGLDKLVDACNLLAGAGVRQISLADTVGLATPMQIQDVVEAAMDALGSQENIELGVHLHARRDQASEKVYAAYAAGCRRFDGALGGLGGCPFAQDSLVGNIPTEILLATLRDLGARLPELRSVEDALVSNLRIAEVYGMKEIAKDLT